MNRIVSFLLVVIGIISIVLGVFASENGPRKTGIVPDSFMEVTLQGASARMAETAFDMDKEGIRSKVRQAVARCWDPKLKEPTCSALEIAVQAGLADLIPLEVVSDLTPALKYLRDAGMPPQVVAAAILASPSYHSPEGYRQRIAELRCRTNSCHALAQFSNSSRLSNAFGFELDPFGDEQVYEGFRVRSRDGGSASSGPVDFRLDEARLSRFEQVYKDPAFAALRADAMRRFRWITAEQTSRFGIEMGVVAGSTAVFIFAMWASEAVLPLLFESLETTVVATVGGVEITQLDIAVAAVASLSTATANRWATGSWLMGLKGKPLLSYVARTTPLTALTYFVTVLGTQWLFAFLAPGVQGEIVAAAERGPGSGGRISELGGEGSTWGVSTGRGIPATQGNLAAVASLQGTAPGLLPVAPPTVGEAAPKIIVFPIQSLARQAVSGTEAGTFLNRLAGAGVGTLVVRLFDDVPAMFPSHVVSTSKPFAHTTNEISRPKQLTRGYAGPLPTAEELSRRRLGTPAGPRNDPSVVKNDGSDRPASQGDAKVEASAATKAPPKRKFANAKVQASERAKTRAARARAAARSRAAAHSKKGSPTIPDAEPSPRPIADVVADIRHSDQILPGLAGQPRKKEEKRREELSAELVQALDADEGEIGVVAGEIGSARISEKARTERKEESEAAVIAGGETLATFIKAQREYFERRF
ncbi:MAG: hypothetical protein V1798_07410, partial [Pseudomonadota bacterium]